MTNTTENKARLIVLDLETAPTQNAGLRAEVEREAGEKTPANNTLKALKEVWDKSESVAARKDEAYRKTALDPLAAEILVVCCAVVPPEEQEPFEIVADAMRNTLKKSAVVLPSDNFLEALADTLNQLAGPETIWCGHNALGFDLPMLLNAWRRAGVCPPEHFPVFDAGRWRGRTYDTMRRTPCANGLGFVGLETACRAFGLPPVKSIEWRGEPMTGARVYDAFLAGEFDLLVEYCLSDTRATLELYRVLTAGDRWGTWPFQDDSVARDMEDIEADPALARFQKDRLIITRLEQAGLVPRLTDK